MTSSILPVKFVKKDACYKAVNDGVALTESEFKELCDITIENVANICNDICKGRIDVSPKREKKTDAKSERRNACSFCNYRSICMFDEGLGCKYDDI